MLQILRAYALTLLAVFSGAATLLAFQYQFFPSVAGEAKIAMVFLLLVAAFFFLESLYLKARWSRERLYGRILCVVNKAFYEVHKLEWGEFCLAEKKDALKRFCDNVSKVFSILSGTPCSACIKVFKSRHGEQEPELVTLCRDQTSARKRKNENDHGGQTRHYVRGNIDFAEIVENLNMDSKNCFFNNQLPFLNHYQNSSFDLYGKPYDGLAIPLLDHVRRIMKWPLPYRSTIVVPICPLCDNAMSHLTGFLCVDSPYMFAFKKQHDLELMKGIADGIFVPVNDVWAELVAAKSQQDSMEKEGK